MKLSYVMPAYNKGLYIAEAINSFLEQRYKNQELVIIDDCSTDDTKEVCEWYQAKHKNVRYYKTTKHIGVANCRNMGRSFSDGDIICVLDADDLSYPNRSQMVEAFFKQNKKLSVMYGSANIIDVTGKAVAQKKAEDFALSRIKNENYVTHSTVAFRNDIVTGYRPNLKFIDDWYFYIDCYNEGYGIGHVKEILSAWRISPDGLTYKHGMKNKEKEALKGKLVNEFKNYDEDLSRAMASPDQQIRLIEILKEVPAKSKVLDIGCNGGYLLQRLVNKRCKAMGVEIAPNLARICRDKSLQVYESIDEVTGKFDRVILADILEHYHRPEIKKMLDKVFGILNKDGKVIITIPYKHSFYSTKFDDHHVADYEPRDFSEMLPGKKVNFRGIFFDKQAIPVWFLIVVSK